MTGVSARPGRANNVPGPRWQSPRKWWGCPRPGPAPAGLPRRAVGNLRLLLPAEGAVAPHGRQADDNESQQYDAAGDQPQSCLIHRHILVTEAANPVPVERLEPARRATVTVRMSGRSGASAGR